METRTTCTTGNSAVWSIRFVGFGSRKCGGRLGAQKWGLEDIEMKTASNSRVLRTIPLILIVVLFCPFVHGKVIQVDDDGPADFDNIQAGIDAGVDGDTVLVAPGEYIITEPITFRGKAITVKSEAGRDQTTIRMGTPADTNRASVVIFENGETIASVLDGFTITGGRGCRAWIPEVSEFQRGGGGICFGASSGTVRNCAIVQNRAEHSGGGLICWDNSSATLTDCIIRGNSATELNGNGGGVFCGKNSSMTMTDCAITDNTATESGGGLLGCIDSSITMTDCIIRGNSATEHYGGGVCCDLGTSLTMTDCTIAENSAGKSSGGVACWKNSPMTLTNCTIVENSAPRDGGLGSAVNSPTIVINCTIWGNSADIRGGGLSCYDGTSATVTNSILWGNTAATGIGDEIYLEQAPTEFSITYSNVAGGQAGVYVQGGSTLDWGEGNIDADPLLVDPTNGDYHLKSQAGRWDPNSQSWVQDDVTSPCIDAGDPMSPIGLEPFPNGGFVNMGAYGGTPEASKAYFGEPVCETIVAGDINGDCQVDRADLEIMALHWTDDVPLPLP